MIIEEGYWNYYLAFRIENYQKHVQEMAEERLFDKVIAYVSDNESLVNVENEKLFEERKNIQNECISKLNGKEQIVDLRRMYENNDLPEFFFDFDEFANDSLQEQIKECIGHVEFVNSGYRQCFDYFGEGKCGFYVLMPLKIYYSEWEFEYCPVYIQLLTNGNGLIKLQVPIKQEDAAVFAAYPLKRWFSHIKIWEELYKSDGEKAYKILAGEIEGVEDISNALMTYVQNLFPTTIVDRNRFLGLETFVISKSSSPNILNINEKATKGLEELYYFVYPENFAIKPNEEELLSFWKENHCNISGVQAFFGDRDRIVMYDDVQELLVRNNRENVPSDNDYLQASIAASFDAFILLALAQKDNEMSIYRLAERDRHTINRKMVQYNSNANYLDGILLNAPKHGKAFYEKTRDMLDDSMVDFRQMLERMQVIEEYEKLQLNEKQNASINKFTLMFTVLFGLPLINESLHLLKYIIGIYGDIVPIITIGHIALVIWLILLFILFTDNIDSYLEYEGVKIEDKLPIRARFKKLFVVIGLWLVSKLKKN